MASCEMSKNKTGRKVGLWQLDKVHLEGEEKWDQSLAKVCA